MAARGTTMRSRFGTKLYAVRDESGQWKDIQTYKRVRAADMRRKSKAEKTAAKGPIEKKTKDAVKSVKGAVAAVGRAAKRAVKHVAGALSARKVTATSASKLAAKKPVKTAAEKAVKRVAKKK